MDDKAIRSAKLTLGGMLEKRRAKGAVERAQGQIAPSKYLPGVPRQVHASGGKVSFMQGNHPEVPEVLYHGTKADFHSFEPLSHFGTAKAANERASQTGGTSVIPVHVSMRRPLDLGIEQHPEIKNGAWMDDADMLWQVHSTLKRNGHHDAAESMAGVAERAMDDDGLNDDTRKQAADTIRSAGYDGLMYTNRVEDKGSRSFVALGPEQVKSSLSATKFDPTNPDMTFADGGRIHANKGGKMGARADFIAGNHPEVPSVVYHSTKSDFHDFRPMSHFGTMQAAHDRYSPDQNLSEGMSVMPVHISLKNPLDVGRERDWQSNRDTIRQAADAMFKSGRLDQDYLKAAEKMYDLVDDKRWGSDPRATEQRGADLLREAGHDGIIYTNNIEDPGSRSFIALGPEQVKSSIGNKGTFDPTNPDMTFADGGAANAEMFQGIHPDLQNEEGKPMDLYHGTPAPQEFEAFDDAKLGQRDVGFYGRGHYLTPEVDLAKAYADNYPVAEPGAVIGPLHAALKNPFVWDMSDEGKAYRTKKDLETMGIKREGKMDPWDNLRSHEIGTFMKHMKARGHDGVIVKTPNGEGSSVSEIVVFKPTAIKHAEAEVFDPNDPRIRRAEGGKVDLYSKAAKIISGMKDQKMDVADILKYAVGKGAKKAELDHVDVPPGKTTPKQVADHIEFMQPKIGVHKREGGDFRFDNSNDYLREMDRLHDRGMHGEAERLYDEFERFEGHGAADKPRYAQYQLPGGQNYREHILTLDNHPSDQTYLARNHWGKLANPLAHIRMSDRMIGNKKILHVEEMQSDWNNDARRDGFRTGTEKADYDAYVAKMRQDMTDAFNGTDASPMIKASLAQKAQTMDPYMLAMKLGRQAEHNEMARKASNNLMAPPRAPYINPKKDDWAELAMKHVMTEAAKGGYDGIAFTPDEAQSERWGGTDFSGIYNKKLPSMAQRLVQQHDPETDPDDMTHLQGWAVPMIPLSEKARSGIMQNGFSSFRRGGYVTHVRSAR